VNSARRAFTLIELMLAVAVSVIVVAGLYALFTVQSRQFLLQDMQMSMHQNLRFSMDILSRTARMAGYGTSGSTTGYWGWDGTAIDENASMPAVISYNSWGSSGTDAITITYADPSLEMNTTPLQLPPATTTELYFDMTTRNYSGLIGNYAAGELVMCWDLANQGGIVSMMWPISTSGNSSTGVLGVSNLSGVYSDFDAIYGSTDNLPPTMQCSKAHVVSFYVDDTDDGVGPGSPTHPVLMMDLDLDWPEADDVPLVDDVEDLQFAYCLAGSDCSDTTAESLGGPWINDRDLTAAEGTGVWMVRMTVVARTSRIDPRERYTSTPPTIEDHSPAGSADNYYRQSLTTMVTTRNMRF
jgi:prepilin-type N-terminal cleavage/methylation domain-containing protein